MRMKIDFEKSALRLAVAILRRHKAIVAASMVERVLVDLEDPSA